PAYASHGWAASLFRGLRAAGVGYIIGNPGTTELPLMDVLPDHPDFKYILTLQEGVAMAPNRKNKRHVALAPGASPPSPGGGVAAWAIARCGEAGAASPAPRPASDPAADWLTPARGRSVAAVCPLFFTPYSL